MRQFGKDLIYADFRMNSLTALESKLFEFNKNLTVIFFNDNPLKFIDPVLIHNLLLNNVTLINFRATCNDQGYIHPRNIDLKEICNDIIARNENIERMKKRENFFVKFFPDIINSRISRSTDVVDTRTFIVIAILINLIILLLIHIKIVSEKVSNKAADVLV